MYTCTEDVEENGRIIAYSIDQKGFLRKIDEADAGGKSTCYITIDHEAKNILICNYWDSTLSVIPLSRETGKFLGPIKNTFDPRGGRGMVAATNASQKLHIAAFTFKSKDIVVLEDNINLPSTNFLRTDTRSTVLANNVDLVDIQNDDPPQSLQQSTSSTTKVVCHTRK